MQVGVETPASCKRAPRARLEQGFEEDPVWGAGS
jgi:hypothetical protein